MKAKSDIAIPVDEGIRPQRKEPFDIPSRILIVIAILLSVPLLKGQTDPAQVKAILSHQLQPRQVVTFQLQQFLMRRAPKLPSPASAAEWTAEARQMRHHLLSRVIYHGWPADWVSSPPQFEDMGRVPTGKGYQLRKLRYQIVPGFYATALLYEPEPLTGKMPAVLNLMGHWGGAGNAMEFKQRLCINQALRGMIALSLDWIDMGESFTPANNHWFGADLDLVGANGLGLFYLSMRRGLDYLYNDPHVDRSRIAVTGMSGGGWQTIVLSGLDPRVDLSVPVAGFASLKGRIERLPGEPGDFEQNATDFFTVLDYPTLAAMRAPRPTLIIDNAEDSCCFRAPLVKPYVYDAVKPFFQLYGQQNALQFHADTGILAHNYGIGNRQQAYRFMDQTFGLAASARDIPVGSDLKTLEQLKVDLPADNLTVIGLARKMAAAIERPPIPSNPARMSAWALAERAKLRQVVRFHPVSVRHAWLEYDTDHNQVQSISYRFEMSNGLGATGVWLKETSTPREAPLTILLDDHGFKGAVSEKRHGLPEIADRMERGERVLVVNPLFTGDASPDQPRELFTEMLAATGERPLGMEAAQVLAVARWADQKWAPPQIRLESTGIRSQMIALVAAGLNPHRFAAVVVYHGMTSLSTLLEKPVPYKDAPDLFCLDLYKDFDVGSLERLARPARVTDREFGAPIAVSAK